jgi:hypothetical protein
MWKTPGFARRPMISTAGVHEVFVAESETKQKTSVQERPLQECCLNGFNAKQWFGTPRDRHDPALWGSRLRMHSAVSGSADPPLDIYRSGRGALEDVDFPMPTHDHLFCSSTHLPRDTTLLNTRTTSVRGYLE